MRDLDRGLAALGVAVERQQPVSPERLDHRVHGPGVGEREQLGAPNAPAGALGSVAERHQPQEQLTARMARRSVQRLEQRLGPPGKRSRDASDRAVGLEREGPPLALRELRQRVLEERKCSWTVCDIGHHRRDEPGVDLEAHSLGRAGDRPFELVRRHRSDRLGALGQQVPEPSNG